MKNILRRMSAFLFMAGLVCLGLFVFEGEAFADGKPDYRLQISPLYESIGTLKPGATYEGELEVQNSGNKAYSYKTEIIPYGVTGEDYTHDFDTKTKYNMMVDWIEITQNSTARVEPSTASTVKFRIKVPEDAPAGSQSAAIAVSMINDEEMTASGVQAEGRIAYYFFGNVDGETRTTVDFIKNKIPSFLFNPPIFATSVVKNTGNVYGEAKYILEVRELFSNKLAYTNVTEDHNGDQVYETKVIFPETERYNEVSWDGAPQLGLFKVRQTIILFDEMDEKVKVVFLCPIWFLILVIVFIAVMIFWITSRIAARKREK